MVPGCAGGLPGDLPAAQSSLARLESGNHDLLSEVCPALVDHMHASIQAAAHALQVQDSPGASNPWDAGSVWGAPAGMDQRSPVSPGTPVITLEALVEAVQACLAGLSRHDPTSQEDLRTMCDACQELAVGGEGEEGAVEGAQGLLAVAYTALDVCRCLEDGGCRSLASACLLLAVCVPRCVRLCLHCFFVVAYAHSSVCAHTRYCFPKGGNMPWRM